MTFHKFTLILLYVLTLCSIAYLFYAGGEYYELSRLDRPHHDLHKSWKPGGYFGHGLGIVGSTLMVILFLYSVRKRFRFMQNSGDIRYWLNYHIWMGVTGPVLVIFHTTFKFGGIVSISFWSMVAVALSGVFGRYIYIQIPRTLSGNAMTAKEIEEQDSEFEKTLKEDFQLDESIVQKLLSVSGLEVISAKKGISSLFYLILNDFQMHSRLNSIIKSLEKSKAVVSSDLKTLKIIARKRNILHRRMAFLQTAHRLLHYWHVIHRPFAIVMIIIMLIHVAIAILFGYRWIF